MKLWIIITTGIIIALIPIILAAVTGELAPTGTGQPNDEWTYGYRIKVSDNSRAYTSILNKQLSAHNFSFSIPEGATIDGIRVEIEGDATGARCGAIE